MSEKYHGVEGVYDFSEAQLTQDRNKFASEICRIYGSKKVKINGEEHFISSLLKHFFNEIKDSQKSYLHKVEEAAGSLRGYLIVRGINRDIREDEYLKHITEYICDLRAEEAEHYETSRKLEN